MDPPLETPATTLVNLGERVAYARKLGQLSQYRLSLLAGLNKGHVRFIENGQRASIDTQTANGLAEVLGVSLDWLVAGRGDVPTRETVLAAVGRARSRAADPAAGSTRPRTGTEG